MTVYSYRSKESLRLVIFPLCIISAIRLILNIKHEIEEANSFEIEDSNLCGGIYDDQVNTERAQKNEKSSMIFLIILLCYTIILLLLKFLYQLFNKKKWQILIQIVLALIGLYYVYSFEWINGACGVKDTNVKYRILSMEKPLPPIALALMLILNLDRVYN